MLTHRYVLLADATTGLIAMMMRDSIDDRSYDCGQYAYDRKYDHKLYQSEAF